MIPRRFKNIIDCLIIFMATSHASLITIKSNKIDVGSSNQAIHPTKMFSSWPYAPCCIKEFNFSVPFLRNDLSTTGTMKT